MQIFSISIHCYHFCWFVAWINIDYLPAFNLHDDDTTWKRFLHYKPFERRIRQLLPTLWAFWFFLTSATSRDVLITPYFRISGYVHVDHTSCVITKLWPTSVKHPFSFSILLYAKLGENIIRNYYPYLMTVPKKFAFQCFFPYIIGYPYYFSLYFFWLGFYCNMRIYSCPGNYLSAKYIVNWYKFSMTSQRFFLSFFIKFNCDMWMVCDLQGWF